MKLRWILRVLRYGFGIASLGLLALMAWVWWQHNRVVALPAPDGSYAVGRAIYDWADPSRRDPFAPDVEAQRTLNVWVWYPAAPPPPATPHASYLPSAWVNARAQDYGVLAFLTQNLVNVQAHSFADVPLSPAQQRYPVLLMQPGLGPSVADYTTLAEHLASHGYVVVGINPTYSSNIVVFGDGQVVRSTPAGTVSETASLTETKQTLDRLITIWVADDRFALDHLAQLDTLDPTELLTGRLDLQAVGIFGHSFGGATAAEVCHLDARCKAGVDLDGYPYGDVVRMGLNRPFLFVWSEQRDTADASWQQARRDTSAIVATLPRGSYQMSIRGARHFNFSDAAVFFAPVLRLNDALGPIAGQRGLAITCAYVRAFFDQTLNRTPAPLLAGPSQAYPEVQIETR